MRTESTAYKHCADADRENDGIFDFYAVIIKLSICGNLVYFPVRSNRTLWGKMYKKKNILITLLIIFLLFVNLVDANESKSKNVMEYIENTKRLWGISEVILQQNNSLVIVDSKNHGDGVNLILQDENKNRVDKTILKEGQSCLLTDFRHVFITYKYIGIKNSKILVEVTDKFDARSFGDGIKEEQKKIMILPYQKTHNPQIN